MRRFLVTALCGLMVLPTLAVADGDDHGRGPPPRYYHYEHHHDHDDGYRYYGHGGYYPYYAPRYSYYPYYGSGHHHDNDDAFWAIGGLMLGAIIGNAAAHSYAPHGAATTAVPPAGRPPSNCDDSIVYDSAGNPHVQRNCN